MSVFAFTSILECAPQFAKQPPLSKACLPGENSGGYTQFLVDAETDATNLQPSGKRLYFTFCTKRK